jgi:hypothetical protein
MLLLCFDQAEFPKIAMIVWLIGKVSQLEDSTGVCMP